MDRHGRGHCRLLTPSCSPAHHYCTLSICYFPPDNQGPLNYVPLRRVATNWKRVRWNKGTLAAQIHKMQLPETKEEWEERGRWREVGASTLTQSNTSLTSVRIQLTAPRVWKVHSFFSHINAWWALQCTHHSLPACLSEVHTTLSAKYPNLQRDPTSLSSVHCL